MERGTPVQVTFLPKTSDINRTAQFVGMQPETYMRTTLSHPVAPSLIVIVYAHGKSFVHVTEKKKQNKNKTSLTKRGNYFHLALVRLSLFPTDEI